MPTSYFFRVTVLSSLALLLIKIFLNLAGLSGMIMPILVSWVQDTLLLLVVYLIFSRLNHVIGAVIAGIIFLSSLLYSTHIADLIQYPINIFRADTGLAQFFFTYFVSATNIVLIILALAMVFFVAKYFPKTFNRHLGWGLAAVVVLFFLVSLGRPPINPVVYSAYDEILNIGNSSEYAGKISRLNQKADTAYTEEEFNFLDKRSDFIPRPNFRYKKVVLMAMETVERDPYYNDSTSKTAFWNTGGALKCERHDNYYATNLDSYPSLYVMFHSLLYPYKAYGSKVDSQMMESNPNNLLNFFNQNGFSTHFISTYDENPWIPNRADWKEVKERKDFDETDFTCLNTSRIDSACEDKIALDYIIESLKQNDKAFVMQELAYGHISKWQAQTGIKQLDYYNQLFNELYKKLQENNLLEDTLVVVVADHGDRTNSMDLGNYEVPLLMCGVKVESAINTELLSHLDFKDQLLKHLTGQAAPKSSERFYVVGSSNQWVYGEVTPEHYTLINDNTLAVVTIATEQAVINLNQTFQRYLGYLKDQIQKE